MSHHGVVYRITCQNCDASYIGQTKRKLRTRTKEHNSDIRKKNGSPSVITEHRLNLNYDFEWDSIKLIDNERSYHKRLISEMVHIKKQQYGLNKQSDTDLLSISYLPYPKSPSPFLTLSFTFSPPPFFIFFSLLLCYLSAIWYSFYVQHSELLHAFYISRLWIIVHT